MLSHLTLSLTGWAGMSELNIHTSDRIAFKRCRRVWNWTSPLRGFLRPKTQRAPLWFGTGWHFVMEDFHGLREYGSPVDTWRDYVKCTYEVYGEEHMPNDWRTLAELGEAMARYYEIWLVGRDPLQTYVLDGIPQTEVNFKIPLPVSSEVLERLGVEVIYYNGTLDRVIENEYGMLAIGEYKTAKNIYKAHYLTDPQVTAYSWAANCIYDRPVNGVYYYQFKKGVPDEPPILKSGRVSTNKQMATTHRYYRDTLIRLYGDVRLAPKENVDHLNWLTGTEEATNDGFISRDFIDRNEQTLQAEGVKILMELEDMLNPDLPLYPNPTRECVMFPCDFKDACVALDDGDNWEQIIQEDFERRDEANDQWRPLLQIHKPRKELILPEPPVSLLRLLQRQGQQQ